MVSGVLLFYCKGYIKHDHHRSVEGFWAAHLPLFVAPTCWIQLFLVTVERWSTRRMPNDVGIFESGPISAANSQFALFSHSISEYFY